MIFTDGIHLISDESLEELFDFGTKMGFRREWVHHTPGRPHFDLLTDSAVEKALSLGAKRLHRRDFVTALRRNPDYIQWQRTRGKKH